MTRLHSFGGSALDRHIFEFETPEGGGDAPVGDVVTETPAEPAWTGPSQDEWQQTQEQLAQYAQMLQPPQQNPEQQPLAAPDPFSESYQQDLEAYIDSRVAPFQQFQQQVQLAAAEERAMELLNQQASTVGEFDRGMAMARANQIMYQNGGTPESALAQAAKETREYERRVGEQYHQQQIEQIQGVAGAPRHLPPGTPAGQTVPVGSYGNQPNAVTNRLFGRR